MTPLTTIQGPTIPEVNRLTRAKDTLFCIKIDHHLQKKYCFKSLGVKHIKAFQRFIDKACSMTYSEVDKVYLRQSDKQDKAMVGEEEFQIVHYEVDQKFRIHGIIIQGQFKLIRLDPEHKHHQKGKKRRK